MQSGTFTVGSAASEALVSLQALLRREDYDAYRTIDLINMALFSAQTAGDVHGHLPVAARDYLIHGASRLLAAAERLPAAMAGQGAMAQPMRAVS